MVNIVKFRAYFFEEERLGKICFAYSDNINTNCELVGLDIGNKKLKQLSIEALKYFNTKEIVLKNNFYINSLESVDIKIERDNIESLYTLSYLDNIHNNIGVVDHYKKHRLGLDKIVSYEM